MSIIDNCVSKYVNDSNERKVRKIRLLFFTIAIIYSISAKYHKLMQGINFIWQRQVELINYLNITNI